MEQKAVQEKKRSLVEGQPDSPPNASTSTQQSNGGAANNGSSSSATTVPNPGYSPGQPRLSSTDHHSATAAASQLQQQHHHQQQQQVQPPHQQYSDNKMHQQQLHQQHHQQQQQSASKSTHPGYQGKISLRHPTPHPSFLMQAPIKRISDQLKFEPETHCTLLACLLRIEIE